MHYRTTILGSGNVGTHLHKAFTQNGVSTNLVSSRTLEGIAPSDVYLLCVKDDAIEETAQRLKEYLEERLSPTSCIVAHTAGTKPLSLLSRLFPQCGVFYPMQTFSKQKALSYTDIPIFIEGSSPTVGQELISLAKTTFSSVSILGSEERKRLHVAAVFASNFTNHLMTLADRQMQQIGLDYTSLLPLLDEVVDKLHHLPPREAQTGPAARRDFSVINEHLSLIEDEQTRTIYRLLSQSIYET
ncbi:MAG: DUF2520 domain-containing protein [Bacteroidaceae bacterium]|nr:DUF2520 domain-containing protein [Bacteroidaceae bacterium]